MSKRIACKLDAPDGLIMLYDWHDHLHAAVCVEFASLAEAKEFAKGLTPDCDLVLEIPDAE
jgi:hypothetical protein